MAPKKKSTAVSRKRLLLLDSHAILHRAFHAIPDFATSKGEVTGALYGLVTMLLKAIDDVHPDYIVATRDLPGGTHRHEKYEAYKATRVKADDGLIEQLEKAPGVFKAFGIPVYEAPGFEADDILGTIVENMKTRDDVEIIIASGDLDTLQLVDGDRVRVYTLRQGISDTILYDEDRVKERYGFEPSLIPDYKGLRGDPSDNIKGIRGIGEKTAETLVTEFGSIEDIYTALKSNRAEFEAAGIKKRVMDLLEAGEEDARLSKEIATIHPGAPISFSLPQDEWRITDHIHEIQDLFDHYEFRSLKERLHAKVRDVPTGDDASPETVDEALLKETAVALWLVRSDMTNPTLEDVYSYTHVHEFEEARRQIMATLESTGRLKEVFDTIERPLIPVVERMNKVGIHLDTNELAALAKEYGAELGTIAGRIFQHVGHEFNINSPKQLGDVLYDELKLSNGRVKKTATGARSTKEEELTKLIDTHPIIADILAYRELQKLLSTYVEKMADLVGSDGRLHAEFLQTGTTTGRMGCQNPNLQNIPIKTEYGRRIRDAFTAPQGTVLLALDYSQIELRVAAGLSGDEKLIETFQRGGDIHATVASQVFGVAPEKVDKEMRRRAKVINFGILYGMGVNALKQALGADVGRDDAQRFLDDYFAGFPTLAAWIEQTKKDAAKNGYTETVFGRRRYFSGFQSALPHVRAQAERMAINAPIQGTQADIIKLAMVKADECIEKENWRARVRLMLQVHDELVYEVDEAVAHDAARHIKHIMETVAPRELLGGVPIVADVSAGASWGALTRLPL